jgi:hypothetical protein
MLALLVACGSTPDPVSMAPDHDGDGWPVGRDCHDANPDIHPGAREIWYDGIDQDCDGQDDWDADQDGFVGGAEGAPDCDDTRPEVNPDAEEIWYDGLDQDCDGWSDFDKDSDGFDAQPWGTDCNDDTPTINPDISETWYDGVDSDCDGADDFDADGDGVRFNDDCNDHDASAYPNATEIWYDGIDQDCDGNDDDQDLDGVVAWEAGGPDCDDTDPLVGDEFGWLDNDGDGFGDPATAGEGCTDPAGMSNGDDCDDTDAATYPGAEEIPFDGIDQDCDGDTSDTIDVLTAVSIAGRSGGDRAGTGLATADLDGDGRMDFIIGSPGALGNGSWSGEAYVQFGPISSSMTAGRHANILIGADPGEQTGQSFGTGDFDGDGIAELAIGSPGLADVLWSPPGSIFLTRCTQVETTYLVLAEARLEPEGAEDLPGWALVSSDQDLDGQDELYVSAPGAGMVYGLTEPLSKWGLSQAEVRLTGDKSLGDVGQSMLMGGDLDGDGLPDLVVGSPGGAGEVAILLGPVISGALADADVLWAGEDADESAGHALADLGDANGDGLDDLAVGAPTGLGDQSEAGRVYILLAPATQGGSLGDADGVLLGDETGEQFGLALAAIGDHTESWLAIGAPGHSDGAGELTFVSGIPEGTHSRASVGLLVPGTGTNAGLGTSLVAFEDQDGDGLQEFWVSAPRDDFGRGTTGGAYLILSGSLL